MNPPKANPQLRDVERQALQLPATDRETLVERLLGSLAHEIAPDVRQAWVREAERRALECREGRVETIPGDRLFQDIRQELGWQS